MISPVLLIKLSENDKRLIFVLLIALIILLLIIGAIGYLITKVMKRQASKLETAVYDVVVTKVIVDEKHFKKYAWRKNCQMFLKQAWIPLVIIATGSLILLIRAIVTNNWAYNPFNYQDGFASVLWVWNWAETPTTSFFGITIMNAWPPILNEPHLVGAAWAAYIFVPCLIVGGIWYIIAVQGFFARLLKTNSLAHSVFKKSLENYNQTRGFTDGGPQPAPVPPQTQTQTQPQQTQPVASPFGGQQNNGGNQFPPIGGQQ